MSGSELRREKQLLGVVITLLLLVKCTPFDYEGKLPNGYELVKTNSSEIVVTSRRSVVFAGDINQMGVRENLVFGKIDELPPEIKRNRLNDDSDGPPGYFILDTRTGSFQLGLAKGEWLSRLEKLGISGEPALRGPTVFADEPRFITIFKLFIFLGVLKFLILPLQITGRKSNQQG